MYSECFEVKDSVHPGLPLFRTARREMNFCSGWRMPVSCRFWLTEIQIFAHRGRSLLPPFTCPFLSIADFRAGQLGTVVETVFRRLCTVLLGALRPACKPMLDVNIPIEDGSSECPVHVVHLGRFGFWGRIS